MATHYRETIASILQVFDTGMRSGKKIKTKFYRKQFKKDRTIFSIFVMKSFFYKS